jgi:hypothetical protein
VAGYLGKVGLVGLGFDMEFAVLTQAEVLWACLWLVRYVTSSCAWIQCLANQKQDAKSRICRGLSQKGSANSSIVKSGAVGCKSRNWNFRSKVGCWGAFD